MKQSYRGAGLIPYCLISDTAWAVKETWPLPPFTTGRTASCEGTGINEQ